MLDHMPTSHATIELAPFVVALLLITGSRAARAQEHVSIFGESGRSVRLTLVDARGKALANEQVELRDVACVASTCHSVAIWTHRAGTDGSVDIPRTLIHAGISVVTPSSEPRDLGAAAWRRSQRGWVLGLAGHAGTICTSYDDPTEILVADDWRSAIVNPAGDFGLMACDEAKEAFRACAGPQVPDAGLSATFTRSGDGTIARLTGESIAGPREMGRFDCWRIARAEPPPRHPASFALEYSLTGGQSGLDRHLRLTQARMLDISANAKSRATVLHRRAGAELMAAVNAFLEVARPAQPVAQPVRPDAVDTSLALIAGGVRFALEPSRDLAQRLGDAFANQLENAIVGAWQQSGWTLCHPASRLTADQMDPPIERLEFEADGRFSVTWRGGGAHVYDDPSGARPHTTIPDYSGHYDIDFDRGRIRLTFESGIHAPRDFAGDGFFRIDGDTLSLTRVWLGTFAARRRPDVCELNFSRIAAAQGTQHRVRP